MTELVQKGGLFVPKKESKPRRIAQFSVQHGIDIVALADDGSMWQGRNEDVVQPGSPIAEVKWVWTPYPALPDRDG